MVPHKTLQLCAVSASGAVLPPLMVFAKNLPPGQHFLQTGPVNAEYASSESVFFFNQDIYLEWFNKLFLHYAPAKHPLPLLQDGTSAHLGVDLIDAAIKMTLYWCASHPQWLVCYSFVKSASTVSWSRTWERGCCKLKWSLRCFSTLFNQEPL